MTLPAHLFLSDDGGLYDTRLADWSAKPLRANYRRTHTRIETVADLKATLRAGPYAWPGGYPMFFVMGDGDALSFAAMQDNFREAVIAIEAGYTRGDGWRPVAVEINYEDPDLYCAHSGNRIESAYAEEEAEGTMHGEFTH